MILENGGMGEAIICWASSVCCGSSGQETNMEDKGSFAVK